MSEETAGTPASEARLPASLCLFVAQQQWTYAKTMPRWPHEYLVRERVDEQLFLELVQHIRQHGVTQRFYRRRLVYYEHEGLLYWTMGYPLSATTIINRCRTEDSYEYREARGLLPEEDAGVEGA